MIKLVGPPRILLNVLIHGAELKSAFTIHSADSGRNQRCDTLFDHKFARTHTIDQLAGCQTLVRHTKHRRKQFQIPNRRKTVADELFDVVFGRHDRPECSRYLRLRRVP